MSQKRSLLEIILIDFRWILVIVFLLPLSFVYNLFDYVRNQMVFRMKSAPGNHRRKVENVQNQVLKWRASGVTQKMCTARPTWQTMSFRRALYKNEMYQIDCNLIDILEIDTTNEFIRVEPMATIGQIIDTLLQHGYSLPIVPELEDLTIGGLIMGTGVESSSHIYGLFQHICLSYELVMADGKRINCSRNKDPDIFYAIPWSHGTIGFLVAAKIKIISVSKFVRIEYECVRGLDNIVNKLNMESQNKWNDFVEGIQYNLDEAVIMIGRFVQNYELKWIKTNQIGLWYKPWFFMHVKNIADRDEPNYVEYIPLRDYYHRHSRSLFWEIQDIIPFGNHFLFRWLFGWMIPIKVSLLKLTQTSAVKKLYEQNHIIQDMLIPIKHLRELLQYLHENVRVYPLWLCPFKLPYNIGMVHPRTTGRRSEMYIDVGIYGVPKVDDFRPKQTTRQLENVVAECSGFQMLHADTYRTRREFRQMFDHSLYDAVRERMFCSLAFPEVYDKVKKTARS